MSKTTTDNIISKSVPFIITVGLFVSLVNLLIVSRHPQKVYVLAENTSLEGSETYWTQLLKNNPTYFEGWIQLAQIKYRLGKKSEAINALSKAKDIDPNSEKLLKFEDIVN